MANKTMHVRRDDQVMVITGKDAGKKGKIIVASPAKNRVIVEGVNMVTKHQKPRGQGMAGGIITKEAAMDASNVLPICAKCGKPTRVGHDFLANGKKVRKCKKCGAQFDD